jgi:Ca-activated chloride channel homolog
MKSLQRFLCPLAVLLCLVTVQIVQGQRTLSVDVNLVSIFLTAQNARGGFVTGLVADDFRVYEDGVEQKITVFEKEDDVESAIGVLVDNSLSVVDILPMIKDGLLDFAKKFNRFQDLFVMTFGTRVRVLHDLGEPRGSFEERLKAVRANGVSLLFDGLIDGMQKVSRSEHDRKALIVFTDGLDNGSTAGFRAVSLEAARSGVLLYFIPIGARILLDEHTLDSLARDTGGRVLYLSKRDPVPPAMQERRQELAKQYYLGYYTTRKPGFHQIRVEIPGRDVRIRAKTGYYGG